jgi:predicted DNA-binding antitoxin AbrB/MazE fold protein
MSAMVFAAASTFPAVCYRFHVELIEAEFADGVLRPVRPLALRSGERVGLLIVRRPDAARWDLSRLSKASRDDERLTEQGLTEWASSLDREDGQ